MKYLTKDGLRYYHQKKVKPTIRSYIDTVLDKSSENAISNSVVTTEFENYIKKKAAGSTTQPIYINSDGVPTACAYSLGKTVPSNALFTDTDTKNTAGSTNTSSKIFLIGATSQAANPQTYSHDTAYVGSDGCLYSDNKKVSVDGHTHMYAGSSSAGGAATSAVKLQTARTITIGNKEKTFDGTGNVSWTLAEIGAVSSTALGGAAYMKVVSSGSSSSHVTSDTNSIPDMSILAYWNGAYDKSGNSRLEYCNRGAFGTIVTKNLNDYASSSHTHMYAGSSSAGGAATSANKINTDAGSTLRPVYFNNGVPSVCAYVLGQACAKSYTDSTSASAIGTGSDLVTERDVYYGLPTINDIHTYHSGTKIYAPTDKGISGYTLHSNGSGSPIWVNVGEIITNENTIIEVAGNGAITLLEASYTLTPGTWIIYNRVYTNGVDGRYQCRTINTSTNNLLVGGFDHLIDKTNGTGGYITLEWIDIASLSIDTICYPAITARPDSGSTSYRFQLSTRAIRIA